MWGGIPLLRRGGKTLGFCFGYDALPPGNLKTLSLRGECNDRGNPVNRIKKGIHQTGLPRLRGRLARNDNAVWRPCRRGTFCFLEIKNLCHPCAGRGGAKQCEQREPEKL